MSQFWCGQLFVVFRKKYSSCFKGAALRNQATTFVMFVLASMVFFSLGVHASGDLKIGGSTRSYPLSGVAEVEAGLGGLLWGTTASPWYGYSRVYFWGASAATYNSGEVAIEIFPLSFLGLRAGGESIQNDSAYSAYDCIEVQCLGRFYRNFLESELSLGAGRLFLQGRWRRELWASSHKEKTDFVDPTSGLIMDGQGDAQTVYQGVVGVKFATGWSAIVGLRYARNNEGEESRFPHALLRFQWGSLTLGLGGGVFDSPLKVKAGSAIGLLRWEIWPSLALK